MITKEQAYEQLVKAYFALQDIERLAAEYPDEDHTEKMFKIAHNALRLLDANGVPELIANT